MMFAASCRDIFFAVSIWFFAEEMSWITENARHKLGDSKERLKQGTSEVGNSESRDSEGGNSSKNDLT